MNKAAILELVRTLPTDERLELLFELWNQLQEDGWQPTLDEALEGELLRRSTSYLGNPGSGKSLEDVVKSSRRPFSREPQASADRPMDE